MIEQKKKLRLEELQVASFVTTAVIANDQTLEIAGGTGYVCAVAQAIWAQLIDPPKVNASADWGCASQIYAHCDTQMDSVVVYG